MSVSANSLYLRYVLPQVLNHSIACEGIEQRAYDKFILSKQLPRKKKKLMRKDALLDYSIAQWGKTILDW